MAGLLASLDRESPEPAAACAAEPRLFHDEIAKLRRSSASLGRRKMATARAMLIDNRTG